MAGGSEELGVGEGYACILYMYPIHVYYTYNLFILRVVHVYYTSLLRVVPYTLQYACTYAITLFNT